MKSLASSKCAGGLLVALAMASLSLMTACGSSNNIVTPNQGGFGDGNLTGTYVISITGTDINTSNGAVVPFAIAGTVVANGTGGIESGTLDINDPGNIGVDLGEAVSSTSAYQIGKDGRGTGTLVTTVGSFNVDFVMITSSHGLISRFDTLGTGSGTIDLQTPTPSISGAYAFSLAGTDFVQNPQGNPLGTVGAFAVNGNSIGGIEDFNNDGSSNDLTSLTLSGQLAVGASGAPSTATLTTNFGSLGFDVWVIDSTHLKFIETDTDESLILLAGDAFTQVTSLAPGQLVFVLGGMDGGGLPVSAGGYATTDANGNLTNGFEDYNDAGTVGLAKPFSTSTAGCVAGRCVLTLAGFTNGDASVTGFVVYPSSGGGQALEIDSLGLLQGASFSQSATAFTDSGGYGLNFSGQNNVDGNAPGIVNDIAQFDAGAPDASFTGTPTPNMTGVLDENDLDDLRSSSTMSGVYVPDSPVDGRGTIESNNNNTELGGFTLQYYVVDPSTVVFIDVDSEAVNGVGSQLGVGTFEAQSSSGGQAARGAAARSHVVIVHPAIRAHGAFERK
ncbi:MAG TPA: hypothetical protein VIH78_14510 [Terriglobales bacterium]